MASEVLQKTRKINKTLQTSGGSNVSFDLLAGALGEVLSSNVYVLSSKGKVLGLHLNDIADSSVVEDDITKQKKFPEEYNRNVLKIKDTLENLTGDELLEVFPFEQDRTEKKTTIVPILGSGQRLGTLVLSRYDHSYEDEDLVIAEYSATVIGLEILRAIGEELEEEMRKKAVVQMAIGTLSYSELEAVEHIFEELDGKVNIIEDNKADFDFNLNELEKSNKALSKLKAMLYEKNNEFKLSDGRTIQQAIVDNVNLRKLKNSYEQLLLIKNTKKRYTEVNNSYFECRTINFDPVQIRKRLDEIDAMIQKTDFEISKLNSVEFEI